MRNRLSLGASWVQGFLEGGMLTFLSIHLLTLGYEEAQVGGLMAALFLGVVLFQTPSAWLADRFGRLRVLAAFHGVLLIGLACLPFCTGPVAVAAWLFVVGGCSRPYIRWGWRCWARGRRQRRWPAPTPGILLVTASAA